MLISLHIVHDHIHFIYSLSTYCRKCLLRGTPRSLSLLAATSVAGFGVKNKEPVPQDRPLFACTLRRVPHHQWHAREKSKENTSLRGFHPHNESSMNAMVSHRYNLRSTTIAKRAPSSTSPAKPQTQRHSKVLTSPRQSTPKNTTLPFPPEIRNLIYSPCPHGPTAPSFSSPTKPTPKADTSSALSATEKHDISVVLSKP